MKAFYFRVELHSTEDGGPIVRTFQSKLLIADFDQASRVAKSVEDQTGWLVELANAILLDTK